jgi:hypothetical protein
MYKNLKLFRFNSDEFWDFITDHVSYSGSTPIVNALRSLLLNYCESVVVEPDYIDKDYLDEYSAYYSRLFKQYPHRALRLHFFAESVTEKQVNAFKLPTNNDSYLGFTIIRPTDFQRMGRTVLASHISENAEAFITCRVKFCTHVLGQELSITGMPFIQQDTQVGACAQAALWMLGRYMSRRFRTREYLPAEINVFAKAHRQEGRLLPAERGLNSSQILDALQAMGLSAEVILKSSLEFSDNPGFEEAFKGKSQDVIASAKLAEIAYRYIESGLPVIFATKDHALVGIGHSYNPNKKAQLAIQRIPSFYVNNDSVGPYQEMPILVRREGMSSFLDVQYIFVVAPPEASLRGDGAEEMAKESLRLLCEELGLMDEIKDMRPDLAPLFRTFEYRTYLKATVELQQELLEDFNENRNRAVAEKLLRLDYPKYVWVTEVSSSRLLNRPTKEQRQCLGRIIVDSTAPKVTFGTMVVHFADVLMIHDRQKRRDDPTAWEYLVVPGSTPFVHMFTSNMAA